MPDIRGFVLSNPVGTFVVSKSDAAIGQQLLLTGGFENTSFDRSLQIFFENDFVSESRPGLLVDIGANIGTHSIYALASGVFNKSIAIEPDQDNYSLLQCNLILNDVNGAVETHNVAVGNRAGQSSLARSDHNLGDHRILDGHKNADNLINERHVVDVCMTTVDNLVWNAAASYQGRLVIWVDVQGFEFQVLSGAKRVLRLAPFVCMELWPRGLSNYGCFSEFMDLVEKTFVSFVDLRCPELRYIEIEKLPEFAQALGEDCDTEILLFPRSRSARREQDRRCISA